jgi:hypothetical protein
MNLFFLSIYAWFIAKYHCDKHVVKMILETTQMLYTCHHLCNHTDWIRSLEKVGLTPYRQTHANHPTSMWVRSSHKNYQFTVRVGLELCYEYTRRYGKVHKCQAHLQWLSKHVPNNLQLVTNPNSYYSTRGHPYGCTRIPLAMPDEYHHPNAVVAYRRYYLGAKTGFAKWAHSETPFWYERKMKK